MFTMRAGDFVIRPLAANEEKEILALYRQCEDFLALGPQPHASIEMVRQDMALSAPQGGLFCGIFDADGHLAGVLDFIPDGYGGERGCAFLELLMIGAPYRGQGLGAAVVRTLEETLVREWHVTALAAGVQVNNPRAIQFWMRMGFRITGGPELNPDGTTGYRILKELAPLQPAVQED